MSNSKKCTSSRPTSTKSYYMCGNRSKTVNGIKRFGTVYKTELEQWNMARIAADLPLLRIRIVDCMYCGCKTEVITGGRHCIDCIPRLSYLGRAKLSGYDCIANCDIDEVNSLTTDEGE